MKGIDAFYTPPMLATKLLSYVEGPVTKVVDFCVGEGNLLKAAEQRFGHIECYGVDISSDVIKALQIQYVHWQLATANSLATNSLSEILRINSNEYDLVLMNPPFTCKGSIIHNIEFENAVFSVSTAMYFLLHALPFMSSDGSLYAIMPISIVRSEKDAKIWSYLVKKYNACILEECAHVPFNKCAPNVVLIYLSKKQQHSCAKQITYSRTFQNLPVSHCIRGTISASSISRYYAASTIYFIHTTNIQNGEIVDTNTINGISATIVKSYGVVVPRVCKPSIHKVALLNPNKRYVLSDCVIAILANNARDARVIKESIVRNWEIFSSIYSGTGAQYTTMNLVKKMFCLS